MRWQQSQAAKSSVQCPVCRAPLAAAALAPSLSMVSVAASGARESDAGGAGTAADGEDISWLAADDMARLRVSQRRWAEGVEQQRLRVRAVGLPSGRLNLVASPVPTSAHSARILTLPEVEWGSDSLSEYDHAAESCKACSTTHWGFTQDGLVKVGGWGVSIDDLQQLQQDTQRAAQAAPAAPPGTPLPVLTR